MVKRFFGKPDIYLRARAGIRLRFHIIQEFLGAPVNSRMLDVGCGDGSLSLPFMFTTSNQLTMMDLSKPMLDISRRNTPNEWLDRIEYINGNFLEYKPSQPFDIVLCIGVLAHVASISDAFVKLAALTKPDGICIMQFTDMANPIANAQMLYHLIRRRTSKQQTYPIQTIDYKKFLLLSKNSHLIMLKQRKYFSMLPGMGYLPDSLAYRILSKLYSATKKLPVGTEVMVMLRRK